MLPSRPEPGHAASDSAPPEADVQAASLDALRSLRESISRAAGELTRLRAENEQLRRDIEELQTRPVIEGHALILDDDEDPVALRRRIESYIELLDRYLATEP